MPQEHLLRKLETALDLSFVYEETAPLYSKKYGRPAIDPVVIVKYLLVGFLYGIPSERQIERRVQTDIALRWYLGLDLFDRVPDHSTISQLRRRKPSFRKVFRRLFEEVVGQCVEKGLVSGRVVGTDSTHVRANASRASEELVEVAEEAGVYWERLDDYEEEGLEELERRTGSSELSRIEFALWGHTTNPSYNLDEVVDRILDLRQRRAIAPAKRSFDKKEIAARGENYDKKPDNFWNFPKKRQRAYYCPDKACVGRKTCKSDCKCYADNGAV